MIGRCNDEKVKKIERAEVTYIHYSQRIKKLKISFRSFDFKTEWHKFHVNHLGLE